MLTVRRNPRTRVALPATLGTLESTAALALAHAVAGGAVPDPLSLLTFGVLVYGASRIVLRRRASIRLVLPALLGAQVLGHAWLVALTPAAHHHATEGAGLLGLSPEMVAAHGVAAVVTGVMWALRRRAVAVLLRWATLGLLPAPIFRERLVADAVRCFTPQALRIAVPSRGPPTGPLALA